MAKYKENLATLNLFVESVANTPKEMELDSEESILQAQDVVRFLYDMRLKKPVEHLTPRELRILVNEALQLFHVCAAVIKCELKDNKKAAQRKTLEDFTIQVLLEELGRGMETTLLQSEVDDVPVHRYRDSVDTMWGMIRKTAEYVLNSVEDRVVVFDPNTGTEKVEDQKETVLETVVREDPTPVIQQASTSKGESDTMNKAQSITHADLQDFYEVLDAYMNTLLRVDPTKNMEQDDVALDCIKGVFSGRLIIAPEKMNDKTIKLLFTDAFTLLRTVHGVLNDVLRRDSGLLAGLKTQVLNAVLQCAKSETMMVSLPNGCVDPINSSSMNRDLIDLSEGIISFINRMNEQQKISARCQILVDSLPDSVQGNNHDNETTPVPSIPLVVRLYSLTQNDDPSHGKKYNQDLENLMREAVSRYYAQDTTYTSVDFKLLSACTASAIVDAQMSILRDDNQYYVYRKKMKKKLIDHPEVLTREIMEHFKTRYLYMPSFYSMYVIQATRKKDLQMTILPEWYLTYAEAADALRKIINESDGSTLFRTMTVQLED